MQHIIHQLTVSITYARLKNPHIHINTEDGVGLGSQPLHCKSIIIGKTQFLLQSRPTWNCHFYGSYRRRQWYPTPVFLPGKSHEPGGLQSMGSQRVFTFTFQFHALEKEMATHSSVLAWSIPGTEEPGGLPSMGSHRVRHNWSDSAAAAAAAAFTCPSKYF